jgi:hypothetical membrane protein
MTAKLGWAGVVAPVWFTLLVIVQSVLQPDYDHIAMPISALAAWPHGWLQNLNFFVFSPLMLAYAIGLHRGVQPSRAGWLGTAFLVLSALGLLLAGVFPWQRVGADFVVPPGHRAAAVLSFLGAGIGLLAMSRRMAADPRWRDRARLALACGIVICTVFLAIGAFAVRDDAPLHASAGLLQRLVLAVWFPCTVTLALRLVRLAQPGTAP